MSRYTQYFVRFVDRRDLATGDALSLWNAGSPDSVVWVGFREMNLTTSTTAWAGHTSLVLDNTDHSRDFSRPYFVFESDASSTAGGVYIDSVAVYGIQRPDILAIQTSIVASGSSMSTTSPVAGQNWYLDFTMNNYGGTASGSFYVRILVDNVQVAQWLELDLAPGVPRPLLHQLMPSVATATTHSVTVRVDATNVVDESRLTESPEINNDQSKSFIWVSPPGPDLVIQSISVSTPSPLFGQAVTVTIVAKNQGALSSGAFSIGFYKDRSLAPSAGNAPDNSQTVGGLAINGTVSVTFVISSAVADTMSMYALADWQNVVPEGLFEDNNAAGPQTVTWRSGGLTVRGRFAYDDSLHGNAETYTQCAGVEVWHLDNDGTDSLLASGGLAADGSYLIGPITNVDATPPPGGDARLNIYVRWNLQSHEQCWNPTYPNQLAVVVKVGDGDSTWHYDTPPIPHVPDGTYDFLMRKPPDYAHRSAAHIFDTILGAWRYFGHTYRSFYGEPGPVTVRWNPGYPHNTLYNRVTKEIFVNGRLSASQYWPDEWDRFVIDHEYGHHLANGLGKFAPLPTDSVWANAREGRSKSMRDAWDEGWAHFIGAAIGSQSARADDYGRDSDGTLLHNTFDLETGNFEYYNQTGLKIGQVARNDSGLVYQSSIAAALWDVQDNVPDNPNGDAFGDSLFGGYGTVFEEVLKYAVGSTENAIHTFCDFESWYLSLWGSDPDFNQDALGVFREHGMFCGVGGVPVGVELASATPRELKLYRNTPNPFNPSTRIRFSLPGLGRAERVLLRIYDVRGRVVRRLLDEDRRGGADYDVLWNGTSDVGRPLASGVYYCRLTFGGQQRTSQITLLK